MAYSKEQLKQLAREAAIRRGVDPDIYERQIGAESNWNPSAVSPAGAKGIAQFMPGTAKDYGIDPLDPVQALDGGARYMRKSLDQFDGDYSLALASYNAGPGAVRKHGGVPPFKETQNYVAKIMGAGSVPTGSIAPGPAYQGQNPTPMPVSMDGVPTRDRPGGAPMNANDDISRALARLEQIRNGLAAPPQQPQMDPWAALGAMGAGILAGGQGHGNWFGRGMNNVMQMQAAQQQQMPQPMTPLEQLKAEGELSKMRADLMQKQAQRKYRDSLSPEMQVLHDAAGGKEMAKAEMNELLKQKFGSGPEGTAKVQNYRYLTEELGVPPEEAQEMVFKSSGVQVNVGDGGSQYGSIPAGYSRTIDPVTGAATDMPNPGTKPYVERQAKEQAIDAAFAGIDDMQTFVRGNGEGWDLSSEERARANLKHQELIGILQQLNESGVLDQNEYERYSNAVPNPGEPFTWKDADDMNAAFDELRRRLQRKTGRAAPETDDDPMDLGL